MHQILLWRKFLFPELRKVKNYADLKGLKLPEMNFDPKIEKTAVTVFESDDPSVPTVIYMPATNDVELQKKITRACI